MALGELSIGTSVVTRAGPKSGGAGTFGAAKSALAPSSSGTLVVKSTHWKAHPEGVAVYNFIVEGFHTYFVGGNEGDKGSGGVWVHNGPPCPPDLDQLSQNAGKVAKSGYTRAGHELAKHASGQRQGNSVHGPSKLFPPLKGGTPIKNQMGQFQVDDILTAPGTVRSNGFRPRFGKTIEFDHPDGRGLVFNELGDFLFFKE